MKKIINSRRYDTDTARELGSWRNGYGYRDFQRVEETLYIKNNGEYFLYGEGGPASKYCVQIEQNSWSGGWNITPLAPDEAQEWAEQHLDADTYESIFGAVSEGGEADAATAIKTIRAATGLSQADFAAALHIPRRTVEKWERGENVPSDYMIELIRFRVSMADTHPLV